MRFADRNAAGPERIRLSSANKLQRTTSEPHSVRELQSANCHSGSGIQRGIHDAAAANAADEYAAQSGDHIFHAFASAPAASCAVTADYAAATAAGSRASYK